MTPQELTPHEDQQGKHVKDWLSGEFRAFAVFDEPLDCIRVVTKDCSAKEVRISPLITVLEANYPQIPGESQIVGVTFKGIAHLCETHHFPSDAPWKLADIMDAMVKDSKPSDRLWLKNVIEPLIQRNELENEAVEKFAVAF